MLSSESDSSQDKGDGAEEEDNAEEDKGGIKTSSDGQQASDGEDWQEHPHTQDALTGVSQLFSKHEDTDPESDPREKVQSAWQKWHQNSPKEDSPQKDSSKSSSFKEEPPTNEALLVGARQKAWLLDTRFDAWHHDKIANSVMGWETRDTICDLPEHGKIQPNHPNPVGPPLDYMGECRVFEGIRSNLYDLCHFYAFWMTGNLPEFPVPWELVTCSQVRNLLKLAQSIGRPYLILVHSTDSVMAISMLQELHNQGGSSTRATPKKKDSKAPTANSQGTSTPTALQMTACHSRCKKSHCHKAHKDLKLKKDSSGDKKKDASPTRKGSGHKAHKDGGRH